MRFAMIAFHQLAFCLLLMGSAIAKVKIVVNYVQLEHKIEPEQKDKYTSRSITVMMDKNRNLSFNLISDNYTVRDANLTLGDSNSGGQYATHARIVNGAIVITSNLETHVIITRIKTDGANSCTATRDYVLRPGNKIYRDRDYKTGTPLAFSSIEIRNITCSISEVN